MLDCCYNFAEWWHLLSLDAPTVAVLWSWFFARAMHLRLPLVATLLLGFATWILYVMDRILDGFGQRRSKPLQERHFFCARHRTAFLATALILAAFSAWMIATRMRPQVLHDGLVLSVFVFFYLFLVHGLGKILRHHRHDWLPKELAVGILFAVATAIPAWSRLNNAPSFTRAELGKAVAIFAVLCWVNCAAIEKWEAGRTAAVGGFWEVGNHASTRWLGTHLQLVAAMIALLSFSAALLAPTRGLMAIYLASAFTSSLFLALDAGRANLSPLSLRIAADAALLTPLALFPILR